MTTEQIFEEINQRIATLTMAKRLLSADLPESKTHKVRRKLSAKGLANIRAGVRKRWAKA